MAWISTGPRPGLVVDGARQTEDARGIVDSIRADVLLQRPKPAIRGRGRDRLLQEPVQMIAAATADDDARRRGQAGELLVDLRLRDVLEVDVREQRVEDAAAGVRAGDLVVAALDASGDAEVNLVVGVLVDKLLQRALGGWFGPVLRAPCDLADRDHRAVVA
jgi:hypothetical protein